MDDPFGVSFHPNLCKTLTHSSWCYYNREYEVCNCLLSYLPNKSFFVPHSDLKEVTYKYRIMFHCKRDLNCQVVCLARLWMLILSHAKSSILHVDGFPQWSGIGDGWPRWCHIMRHENHFQNLGVGANLAVGSSTKIWGPFPAPFLMELL